MPLPEIITITKDVLLGIAAATTAVVAVIGLTKWRHELEGRASFDVARALARATYKLRDALQDCRSPMIAASEFPADYSGARSAEDTAKAYARVYKNRWEPLYGALQDFDTHTLEAEALWGSAIRQKTDQLRQCVAELNAAQQAFVSNLAGGGRDFDTDREFGRHIRDVVSAFPNAHDNPLTTKIAAAVAAVEEQIRPHLRRK